MTTDNGTWRTLDFLSDCDMDLRALYEYWDAKRETRPMPARRDLDPVDFPRLLPNISLVDVGSDPLRLTYRLVGTNEVNKLGYDPTGQEVGEHFFGSSSHDVVDTFRQVIDGQIAVYRNDPVEDPTDWHVQSERLYLPLSDDGHAVNMVMVYVVWRTPGTRHDPTQKASARKTVLTGTRN